MSSDNIYSPPLADLESSSKDVLASRWARLGGYIVDELIMLSVMVPVIFFTGFWDRANSGESSVVEISIFGAIRFAVYLGLNGFFLSTRGQSLGKIVVRTKIVSVSTNKILPLWKVFLIRYIPQTVAPIVPLIGLPLAIVNYLLVFRNSKRCLHDLLAGTKVTKVNAH